MRSLFCFEVPLNKRECYSDQIFFALLTCDEVEQQTIDLLQAYLKTTHTDLMAPFLEIRKVHPVNVIIEKMPELIVPILSIAK